MARYGNATFLLRNILKDCDSKPLQGFNQCGLEL